MKLFTENSVLNFPLDPRKLMTLLSCFSGWWSFFKTNLILFKLKLIVFGYEFPHYKTENGMRELIANGYDISLVILQKFKKLSVPTSKAKVYVKQNHLGNIKELCKINNLKYIVSFPLRLLL